MAPFGQHAKDRISHSWRKERGITGLETAIVLIAFVVVSSVFAFAALSTGLFSADKAKDTINAGLSEARGTLELRGSVYATASPTGTTGDVSALEFQVANAAGGEAVNLDPGETIIRYIDASQSIVFTGDNFSATGLGNADSDALVEPTEIYRISITGLNTGGTDLNLSTDTVFTLEVVPPKGAVLHLERTTPTFLETINDLG